MGIFQHGSLGLSSEWLPAIIYGWDSKSQKVSTSAHLTNGIVARLLLDGTNGLCSFLSWLGVSGLQTMTVFNTALGQSVHGA